MLAATAAAAGALRRPAVSEGGRRRVGTTSPPAFLPPWRRPTARPSRRASSPAAACPGRPAPARSRRSAARISGWRRASVASGSASRWRARLTTANSRSPTSAVALARSPAAISASISSHSSRILDSTASGSFQSKPTLPALAWSFSARVRAVMRHRHAGQRAGLRRCAAAGGALGLFLGFDAVPQALDLLRRQAPRLAEHMRMAANELLR